jgi:NAD(P)-dependent dehydrogenase (short-subunit alcohol dehydrogenase family)
MTGPENQSMIVTGASRGIGRALAFELASRGVNLVLNARSREPLEHAAGLCGDKGARAEAVPGDASRAEVAEALAEKAAGLGDFFGFVHVAGVLRPGPLVSEISPEDFDTVVKASLTAAHRLARAAYPRLLDRGEGVAVFFGSGAAERAQVGIGTYCAAKAAEEHLMRQLAAEHPEVASFVYRPGIVETRMQERARESEGGGAEPLQKVFRSWKEKGELITPEESAGYLAGLLFKDPARFHGRVVRIGEV